jgi:hypothetical protein
MHRLGAIIGIVLLCAAAGSPAFSQPSQTLTQTTLYSPNKYRTERRMSCLMFGIGGSLSRSSHCDLSYGLLWAGEDFDWFQAASGEGDRSVIRDMGLVDWQAKFIVPVVEPLPKLKPGEQRQITIDVSGADGADGRPGRPGENGINGDGSVTRISHPEQTQPLENVARPRRDGKPRIDPMFVKAISGHLYVIHVVDDRRDFYALFRVDALERGDNCTVSWKLIPAPDVIVKN